MTSQAHREILLLINIPLIAPLSVDIARAKAISDTLQRILTLRDYQVRPLIYLEDSGENVDWLCVCVWIRYLELCGDEIPLPRNFLHGDYVYDFAASLHRNYAAEFHRPWNKSWSELKPHELIRRFVQLLGDTGKNLIAEIATSALLKEVKAQLNQQGLPSGFVRLSQLDLSMKPLVEAGLLQFNETGEAFASECKTESLCHTGTSFTALGAYIAFCDMQLRNLDTQLVCIIPANTLNPKILTDSLIQLAENRFQLLSPQEVTLVEQGQPVAARMNQEEAVSFRELCQILDETLLWQEFSATESLCLDLDDDVDSGKMAQLNHLKNDIEQIVGDRANESANGTNYESDLVKAQWQQCLDRWEWILDQSMQQLKPMLVADYLLELAKFLKTHYNSEDGRNSYCGEMQKTLAVLTSGLKLF